MRNLALIIFFSAIAFNLSAQTDSVAATPAPAAYDHYDSLRLVKLNNQFVSSPL